MKINQLPSPIFNFYYSLVEGLITIFAKKNYVTKTDRLKLIFEMNILVLLR